MTPGRESFLNRGVSGIDGKADLFDLARAYTSAELSLHRSGVDEESGQTDRAYPEKKDRIGSTKQEDLFTI